MMIKRLLLCLFLLVPITAQAEIVKDNPPDWIVTCQKLNDEHMITVLKFEHYGDRPSFDSENYIKINEGKTSEWTWVFTMGPNLLCKADKVLE